MFGPERYIGLTGVSIAQAAGDLTVPDRSVSRAISGEDPLPVAAAQTCLPIDRSEPVNTEHVDDSVLHISGVGHWFLEGWIGDHSVEFLVDSGSSVTVMSDSLYQTLVRAGEPVGALKSTSGMFRGANGAPIGISGCSHCVVPFMGLQTEFSILICDLSTDAIIRTDTLGSVLPHTLYINNGLLLTYGGVSLQLHRIDTALSGRVFTVDHCSIPPYSEAVLHCTMRTVGGPDCLKSVRQFLGFVGYYRRFIPNFADLANPLVTLTGKDVPFVWAPGCSKSFYSLRDYLIQAPILAFPTETGQYILDTDASNFGLGGVLSQIQNDVEHVVAYCSHALRPSQRRYCTTKREMLAAMSMRIQFHSYLRGAKFTLRTDHKSLVWLHRFKDTEGMMARWLHALQQFQFSFVHRAGRDYGNADGLSRVISSPCGQCTHPDCPPVDMVTESVDQPFDSKSTGSSEDSDLIPIHSGEDWVALLDDDLSQPATIFGDTFRITTLQKTRLHLHHTPIMDYIA